MNKGDRVRIVNYGHLLWVSKSDENNSLYLNVNTLKNKYPIIYEDKNFYIMDMNPSLVGKTGIIEHITKYENNNKEASKCGVRFDDGSYTSWFDEKQIEYE